MRFVHDAPSPRVVFGAGSFNDLPSELDRLGISRALIVATPGRRALSDRIAALIGDRMLEGFSDARPHVPADVIAAAESIVARAKPDGIVTVGGGSAIGIAKAVVLKTGLPIVAVPTTYSGSEMTSIWGLSDESGKRTGRDARVMAKVVLYDPELTLELPVRVSVVSAFNAMAHCVEALYAADASPFTSMTAVLALQLFPPALRTISADQRSVDARENALYGGMLAGQALASAQMGIHHKICHILGGSFGMPHAETHAVLLPHSAEYNRDAARAEMDVIAASIEADDGPQGLYDLGRELGAPENLKSLGMREEDLDRAAQLAVERPYPNPRPIRRDAVREMLENAYHGRRPRSS